MLWTGRVVRLGLSSSSRKLLTAGGGANGLGVPFPRGCLHTTAGQCAGSHWRKSRGMPANPNAYGPLTDGPDYVFVDGRPTPPGTGKIRRAKEQREISEKIMKLTKEVDFAVHHHAQRTKEKEDERAGIISRKLKPKGDLPPEQKPPPRPRSE